MLLRLLGALSLVFTLSASHAQAESARPEDSALAHRPDELFPGQLRGSVALATGVPFVGMGEVALGVTDRVAIGALFGVSPRVYAVGGRARALLYDAARLRLSLVVPVLYYPETHSVGGAPWMLTRPTLQVVPRVASRVQIPCGVGLVAATTMARIARSRGEADYSDGAGGFRGYDSARPVTAGVWWTLGAGVSVALSPRFTAFGDVWLIFEHAELASADWVGGPPVIASLGLSARL
ncbi:MAG TPA: hypothetical protein VFZ61_04510 [Polyangiales bacterium]